MRPGGYYLATRPAIVLWQEGDQARAYLTIGTVYASSDDDVAQRFKPRLTAASIDGHALEQQHELRAIQDARSDAVDGSYSDLSGWAARGVWGGRADARSARSVSATVCWPGDQGCATASFGRCKPELFPHSGIAQAPSTVDGIATIPAGAQTFYSNYGTAADQCGTLSIRRHAAPPGP